MTYPSSILYFVLSFSTHKSLHSNFGFFFLLMFHIEVCLFFCSNLSQHSFYVSPAWNGTTLPLPRAQRLMPHRSIKKKVYMSYLPMYLNILISFCHFSFYLNFNLNIRLNLLKYFVFVECELLDSFLKKMSRMFLVHPKHWYSFELLPDSFCRKGEKSEKCKSNFRATHNKRREKVNQTTHWLYNFGKIEGTHSTVVIEFPRRSIFPAPAGLPLLAQSEDATTSRIWRANG